MRRAGRPPLQCGALFCAAAGLGTRGVQGPGGDWAQARGATCRGAGCPQSREAARRVPRPSAHPSARR